MTNSELPSNMGNGPLRRPDTLERLLSHCAVISPDKLALSDPPNRNRLEGRSDDLPFRTYSFKSLDAAVTRVANRFVALGLAKGDYIALQMANFSETPIFVLASMRAGLIPCMIPLSWSNEDLSRSFERLKPKALISCGLLSGINYSENMRELAFDHMHIRFVLGAGYDIAEGVGDLSSLVDPQNETDEQSSTSLLDDTALSDLGLVTYIDPVTPVPHHKGQILSNGLLHVLSLELSASDHILSAYPLSSIPGLSAHFYPWLMSGCSLSLHQPFDFTVLQEQMQTKSFTYFAAPEQVIDYVLKNKLPVPSKLVIVRRDSHLPNDNLALPSDLDIFDLWNLGGIGSVPIKHQNGQPLGLFEQGRVCLPSSNEEQLCLAAAEIRNERLYIKGRIFPSAISLRVSLEWISLKKRFEDDWFDTGLAAFPGPDQSILLGGASIPELQKVAS